MKEKQAFIQHDVTISSDKPDAIKQYVYTGLNLDLTNLFDKTLESYEKSIFSIESSLTTLESSMKDLERSFRTVQSNLARFFDHFEQQALSSQTIVFGVKEDSSIENIESLSPISLISLIAFILIYMLKISSSYLYNIDFSVLRKSVSKMLVNLFLLVKLICIKKPLLFRFLVLG